MGERTPVAIHDGPASARLAVAEADHQHRGRRRRTALRDIRLSANWMAAAGHGNDDYALFEMVERGRRGALPGARPCDSGRQGLLIYAHGLAATRAASAAVTAPVSLIVSAFAPVARRAAHADAGARAQAGSALVLIDLADGERGSAARVWRRASAHYGGAPPDLDDPSGSTRSSPRSASCATARLLLAYHDRSDGGLFVTLAEMAFAAHVGLDVELARPVTDPVGYLFAEELGAVVQVERADLAARAGRARRKHGSRMRSSRASAEHDDVAIRRGGHAALSRAARRAAAQVVGAHVTACRRCATIPICAREAFDSRARSTDPGLSAELLFALPRGAARRGARRTGRRSRCCASRASTVSARWPRRSIARGSRRTTCT